jgi:UDP-4-amino-4,6-dideoxy-N-acetyl-beta-L-altrosamine transaminase
LDIEVNMNSEPWLPYGRQTLDDDDVAAVSLALRAEYLTNGPRVDEFELAFAEATGAKNAVVCNSGTAALHLAAMALDLGPGDAAIVPTITFVATANVVRMTGAEVIFADVESDSGLMTAATFTAACARAIRAGYKVKAAFPVHLNGQLCDMPELSASAVGPGVALIEDACHALGVPSVGETCHSRMAAFSTHPVKAIATGEGGCVTTSDEKLASRMRKLRSHGITRDPADFQNCALAFDGDTVNTNHYEMHELGWNYRMPDILCALGISQLKKLDRFWRRRAEIASRYDNLLAPLAPVLKPVSHGTRPHGWHLYPVLINFAQLELTRERFIEALHAKKIRTAVHYIPVHRQPYYQRRYGQINLPGADAYFARCLSLPIFPSLTDHGLERVAAALAAIVATRS